MMNKKTLPLQIVKSQISELTLESVLQTLDRLHDAVVEDNLETTCTVDRDTLVGWLEDIIYTAQEAIGELQCDDSHQAAENVTEIVQPHVIRLYRPS
jgi:4-alpha-glucanotransferase